MKNVLLFLGKALLLLILHLNGLAIEDSRSVYTDCPKDSLSVYFSNPQFKVDPQGKSDVSDELQKAIDLVQETNGHGVLFIPEGVYYISKTIHIWKGIRLIGYGEKRPEFVLSSKVPFSGYKYLFHFCSDRPKGNGAIRNADADTYYSGMQNIDVRIESSKADIVAVKFNVAQHSLLSHMNFRLNDNAVAVEDMGTEIESCGFYGGKYALRANSSAGGWQSLILDSYFEKQKKAAIRTRETGITAIRCHFKQIPTVVDVVEHCFEKLWISDSRFEQITSSALIISNEKNPQTKVNIENLVCKNVPQLVAFRNSAEIRRIPHKIYHVKNYTHGFIYESLSDQASIKSIEDITPLKTMPPITPSDIPIVPPVKTWANIKVLGAVGDGIADDTEILEQAISAYRTIYLPTGHYRITRPLFLKDSTNLVGLNPSSTQIVITDKTPAYQGVGSPVPMIESASGGCNILSGIGIATLGENPRVTAVKWKAGTYSMVNDVRFFEEFRTYYKKGALPYFHKEQALDSGNWQAAYSNRFDKPFQGWNSQYWSLWITEGGGGVFKNIWIPHTYACAGMYVSNTCTEGRTYMLSIEHHVRNEVVMDNVSNWKFYALQLEEQYPHGIECLPLEIKNSKNILFANTYAYRVSRMVTPYSYAVRTENCTDVLFKGFHNWAGTEYAFENTLHDLTSKVSVRSREFAFLNVSSQIETPIDLYKVTKLSGGFGHIDAITSDSKGNVFFVDTQTRAIYKWGIDDKLAIVSSLPINPISLACDAQDHLIAVTRSVYPLSVFSHGDIGCVIFEPADPVGTMQCLSKSPFSGYEDGKKIFYQSSRYRMGDGSESILPRSMTDAYVSPDGKTIVPISEDLSQTNTLKEYIPGRPFVMTNDLNRRTYICQAGENGKLVSPILLAEVGGYDAVFGPDGNVYIAGDHIYVYNLSGQQIEVIKMPERPYSITFAGQDHSKMYICAGTSLYLYEICRNKNV